MMQLSALVPGVLGKQKESTADSTALVADYSDEFLNSGR